MIKIDKFSLLVHLEDRFILINVTPTSIDILDKDSFLNGSSRMPTEFLRFLSLISADKFLSTLHSNNLTCDSLSFCAICFSLLKKNFSIPEILNHLETETNIENLSP